MMLSWMQSILYKLAVRIKGSAWVSGPGYPIGRGWFWEMEIRDGQPVPPAHILPLGDTQEHRLDSSCPCKPKFTPGSYSHQAFDGRE